MESICLIFRNEKERDVSMQENLIAKFKELFQDGGEIRTWFSPGRVNLIGEHTDYNGGHVFPCALTIGTYGIARKRADDKLRFYSINMESVGIVESSLTDLVYREEANWTNMPKGVIWAFEQKGYPIDKGMDLLVFGNIPNASGLSSSASLEVLLGVILKDMFHLQDISMIDIALYAQYAENKFNGMNCGIMDQFAIAMGKKDHAIFLDTASLDYEYAPIQLEDARIVIAASNKKRRLTDSNYNERRSQCETALAELQKMVDIQSLGELTEKQFEKVKSAISDPVNVKRARHAVYENQKTIQAVAALKANDLDTFGKLMRESHISLRDDYEVTGLELDTLVEAAWKQPGVIGARMTGAGFGGCTVNIVENEAIPSFKEQVGNTYREIIGYDADFYVVDIGDGAGHVEFEY